MKAMAGLVEPEAKETRTPFWNYTEASDGANTSGGTL